MLFTTSAEKLTKNDLDDNGLTVSHTKEPGGGWSQINSEAGWCYHVLLASSFGDGFCPQVFS